jgi:hypothetical protein
VSRWKSPKTARKRAEHAAREAARLRKEKRKNLLILGGVILLMIGALVADMYFIAWTRNVRHLKHQLQRTSELRDAPASSKQ